MGGARCVNFSSDRKSEEASVSVFSKFMDVSRALYLSFEHPDLLGLKVSCGGEDVDRITEIEIGKDSEVIPPDNASTSTGDATGAQGLGISDDEPQEDDFPECELTSEQKGDSSSPTAGTPDSSPSCKAARRSPSKLSLEDEAQIPVPLLPQPPATALAMSTPFVAAVTPAPAAMPAVAVERGLTEEANEHEDELTGLALAATVNDGETEVPEETSPTSASGRAEPRGVKKQLKYLWLSAVDSVELEQPKNPFAFVDAELEREKNTVASTA